MNEWTDGYISEIDYVYGYCKELSTTRLAQLFINAGIVLPEIRTACELGFGQGISTNIHAAATSVRWYGTDINPSQASFAQGLAKVSSAEVQLFDDSFLDFFNRPDLPQFDFIGLHGVWSWISDENRKIVVDFISKKLNVGGVVYIGYNTQPGWASMVPVRELFTEHREVMSARGQGLTSEIDSALEFTSRLMDSNPLFANANPSIVSKLKRLKGLNHNYIAHEYFNRDWSPMSFAKIRNWTTPAKISFACSANYIDHINMVNLTNEQQELINNIPDLNFRESVRDFCVNQQFRRDYWVKGPRKLGDSELMELRNAQRFILVQTRSSIHLKISGALGEATLQESIYNPILDIFSDYRPHSIKELANILKKNEIGLSQITQAVLVLTSNGNIMAAQTEMEIEKATPSCRKLNHQLCKLAKDNDNIEYLASPVVGAGVSVSRFGKLFLLAISEGEKEPSQWASYVWEILVERGECLYQNGQAITKPSENIRELERLAKIFKEELLPILEALVIT